MKSKSSTYFAVLALAVAAITLRPGATVVLAHTSVTAMPGGAVAGAYRQTLQQSGGQAPYNWVLAKGSTLPKGLSLDASTGILSGKPTDAGTSEFTLNVTDSSAAALSQRQAYRMKIAAEPFSFDNVMLKDGVAGSSSTQTLVARGGTPPYFWSVSNGSLPDGMKLNSSTGVLSGTATAAKTTGFTIQVKDSASTSETGWQRSRDWASRVTGAPEVSAE
jgi:hypothetical protein